MPVNNFEPDKLLHNHIKCIWYAERNFRHPNNTFEILPDSYIELIFCLNEYKISYTKGNEEKELAVPFVVGLLEAPLLIRTQGLVKTLGIRFFPWGFNEIIKPLRSNEPVCEVTAKFRELSTLLIELLSRNAITDCVELLNRFCIENLPPSDYRSDKVFQASSLLYAGDGRTRIESLAENLFVSVRHLNRLFNRQIAISPKSLARKIRFEKIRDKIFENPEVTLTELAYEFGFSDQSHFTTDFTQLAGQGPKTFAQAMRTLKNSLKEYNVRFSQF